MLLCPKCGSKLIKEERVWRCQNNHSYDIAKRGYVNLAQHHKALSGDDRDMVKARTRFLSHGYYAPLQAALVELVQCYHPGVVIDAGCGEGYYTNRLKQETDTLLGFDLSKHAVDEACKARSGVQYAVASVFHMPLYDACADMVLSVFAPFQAVEFLRVLQPGGIFIKVGPGPQHLMGLKEILYDAPYENPSEVLQQEGLILEKTQAVEADICIRDAADIQALFHMTPYYWKTPKDAAMRLQALSELKTKIEFQIEIYRKDENMLNKHEQAML